jgi:serine phosphatase RsbU (regulator of sigma subunit)
LLIDKFAADSNKMVSKNSFLLHIGLLLIGFFSFNTFAAKPLPVKSGWSIDVGGTVTESGRALPGTVISLYSDSTLLQKITSPDGDFSFVLHADTEYMFTFSKPGYVTNCITFSTKDVPKERAKKGFTAFDFGVSLYKEVAGGADVSKLYQIPLSAIRYDPDFNDGDFRYDAKYQKSMRPFLNILNFDLKQAVKRVEDEKKAVAKEDELKRQKTITYYAIGVLLLVMVFAAYSYWNYRQKKKLNNELDVQNKNIEHKNREITDSINYAKRIQNAILPEPERIYEMVPESFILFKPKDIVSGDFYFFLQNDGKTYFGAADCTGHGVPGAFMSLIGYEKLYDASHRSADTGEILTMVDKGIRKSLRQSTADKTAARDGMDIALCCIEKENDIIQLSYSGANRPLWIIRKGADSLEECKPTKKAIGGFDEDELVEFNVFKSEVKKGDTLYMFSDGYTDQFGGVNGKKFSSKKFKELLLEIKQLTMSDQARHLEDFMNNWKQKEEQIDDILVIGVRI